MISIWRDQLLAIHKIKFSFVIYSFKQKKNRRNVFFNLNNKIFFLTVDYNLIFNSFNG